MFLSEFKNYGLNFLFKAEKEYIEKFQVEFKNRILPSDYDKSIPQFKQIYNAKSVNLRRKLKLKFFI